jgi:hypothetical protein
MTSVTWLWLEVQVKSSQVRKKNWMSSQVRKKLNAEVKSSQVKVQKNQVRKTLKIWKKIFLSQRLCKQYTYIFRFF